MKTAAIAAGSFAIFLQSCSQPPDRPDIAADLACETARMVVKIRQEPAPAPPAGCCKKCTNGKVKSGDGLAWVPCPCPASCQCKVKP